MKLTDLPECNQLAILDHLPLMTQIRTAALVCSTWNRLVDDLARKRTKLVLSFSEQPTQIYNFKERPSFFFSQLVEYSHPDHYMITNNRDRITDSELELIMRKFPNIVQFEYYQTGIFVSQLMKLLQHWRARLRCLMIVIFNPIFTSSKMLSIVNDFNTLWSSLHELPHLRELKVYDPSWRSYIFSNLPNLSQLETLYFGLGLYKPEEAEKIVNNSLNNLTRFAQLQTCPSEFSIEEHENPHVPGQMYKIIKHKPKYYTCLDPVKMSTKLTHFHIRHLYECSHWAVPDQFIYRQYPALTHLSLQTILPLEELLTRYGLHQLEALERLTIIYSIIYNYDLGSMHLPLELTPPSAGFQIQFRTLKRLSLNIVPHCSKMDQLESCFPALRTIKILKTIGLPRTLLPFFSCKRCYLSTEQKFKCELVTFESLFKWKVVPTLWYGDKLVKSVLDVKMIQWELLIEQKM